LYPQLPFQLSKGG